MPPAADKPIKNEPPRTALSIRSGAVLSYDIFFGCSLCCRELLRSPAAGGPCRGDRIERIPKLSKERPQQNKIVRIFDLLCDRARKRAHSHRQRAIIHILTPYSLCAPCRDVSRSLRFDEQLSGLPLSAEIIGASQQDRNISGYGVAVPESRYAPAEHLAEQER